MTQTEIDVIFGVTCHLSWMKLNTAQWRVPGSMTVKSRPTRLGTSSRKLAKALAKPLDAGVVARNRRLWCAELNPPRGPSRSCTCKRKSRLCRTLPPNLTVWLPVIFVSTVETSVVRSEAIPRQAGGKPDDRVVESLVDLDRREPVGKVVDVDALDADLVRRFQANRIGHRFVVVIATRRRESPVRACCSRSESACAGADGDVGSDTCEVLSAASIDAVDAWVADVGDADN